MSLIRLLFGPHKEVEVPPQIVAARTEKARLRKARNDQQALIRACERDGGHEMGADQKCVGCGDFLGGW